MGGLELTELRTILLSHLDSVSVTEYQKFRGQKAKQGPDGSVRCQWLQQWCAGICLTTHSQGRALVCSICPFAWCQYSHHSQFQVTKVTLLKAGREEMHTDVTRELVRIGSARCWPHQVT